MNFLDTFLKKHKKRIIGLDILRSIAILMVVFIHGQLLLPKKNIKNYVDLIFIQVDGVSIFFVLSGFLIGGILLKIINETSFTKKDLLNFWIRRWFRTIPNYLLILIAVLAYRIVVFKSTGDFNLNYLFFTQNFYQPNPNFFPEAWSLTIEEWFYLLFPLLCYFLNKILNNKNNAIIISISILLIIPMVLRIVKYELRIGVDQFDLEFRKIMLLRLDCLMYGIIAAYTLFKAPQFWIKSKYYFLFIGIILLIFLKINPVNWIGFYPPIHFNIESITTFCFLPFLSNYKTTKSKILDAFFIFISLISYSMYLLNFTPIIGHFIPLINLHTGRIPLDIEEIYISNYIMYWVLTILTSYALYRFYENPMTKLRDKIKI